MIPGTVLFDPDFEFKDGAKGRKIFIVLNNGNEGIYVAVKTTSKGDRYDIKHGCQILDRFPNYHLVKGSCCFLSENTWIQLDNFFEFKSDLLMQRVMVGEINRLGVLEDQQAIDLLVCTSHSEDLSLSQEKLVQCSLASLKNTLGEAAC
ncbi:MAG: hypothetical protein KZQ91_19855 [Candidatus Thiodiazotropha sp. (ex Lucinoma borealis)]|nr:hypothetical protein [Candidatus Thiodiazotropha sp. (ex Lucinoma borealis)]